MHAALLLESSSVRSASALIFTAPAGSPAVDHPPSPASLACNILAPIPVMTIALVGIFIGTAERKEPWDSGRAFSLG
jgi:hypothetical protein